MKVRNVVNSLLMLMVYAVTSWICPTSAQAEEIHFASNEEPKQLLAIKILNRFELRNDYGQTDSDENGAVLGAYLKGLVNENEVSKFYSPKDYRENVRANWKKVSFNMMDTKDKKLAIDVQPRDRAVMLKYTIRMDWKN